MLMLKNLIENFELARCALENWEHDEENLTELFRHFRISANAIYPFKVKEKLCFLRLAPADEKLENNVRGEMEFLSYLKKKNYPSMRAIPSVKGEEVLKIQTEWGEYYSSAFECVHGKPLEESDYSPHIMYKYGEALGQLHRLSAEYEPTVRKWTHEDALRWVQEMLEKYNAPDYMKSECVQVTKLLSEIPADRQTYGLVHYDFEPDNVFYDEVNDCCSVIDFDDGMYHFYVLDIEQVFDCLSDEFEGERLKEAKTQFIEGYKSKFELPENYREILPVMRRFCNIYAYARLVRCVAEKPVNQPEWMIGLAERLTQKMQSIEKGVKKMSERQIRTLSENEITAELFEGFNRHQTVTKSLRKISGQWVTVDNCYEENWDVDRFKALTEELKETIRTGGAVFGGFEKGVLRGFAACEGTPMGSRGQYLELSIIQVSEETRGSGMGRALFSKIKAWAAAHGAEKLYISAHSSVESQAFYKAMGCVEAKEYSRVHAEREPFDCQMECNLTE